jgi:hypothetical protein
MPSTSDKRPWTRGEKAILICSAVVLVVGIAWSTWINDLNAMPIVHVPTLSMPSPNAFDYFVNAGNSAVEGWPMSGTRPPGANPRGPLTQVVDKPNLDDPAIMNAADTLLKQNQGALATVEKGLAFQYRTSAVRSFSQPLAYLAPFRKMARIMAFQAEVDAKRGDYHSALTSSLLAIRMGNEIPRGGVLIHYLVGSACESIGRKPIWEYLNSLDAADCRRVITTLAQVDSRRATIADCLIEQKLLGEAGLSEIFHHGDWKAQLIGMTQQNGGTPTAIEAALRFPMISKRKVMADYIARMDAMIDAARGPYGTKQAETSSNPISDTLLIEGNDLMFKQAYSQSMTRLLMTACALRAYELDHGAHPSTLQQLVSSYLKAVPLDPFTTSSTLQYKLAGGNYVLYSVGPDMHDDGGRPVLDSHQHGHSRYNVNFQSTGDIVAGVNGY